MVSRDTIHNIKDLWRRQLLAYFLLIIHANTLKGGI